MRRLALRLPLAPAGLLLLAVAAARAEDAPDPELEAHVRRRAHLRAQLGGEAGGGYALVLAQPITDILLPRQEGDFLYLTGVDEPGGALLLGPDTEILLVPDLGPRGTQFYGHEVLADEATAKRLRLSVRAIPRKRNGLALALAELLPPKARLHVPAYRGPDHAPVRERRRQIVDALSRAREDVTTADLAPALQGMRVVKDAGEIAHLRRAIAITEAAFVEAARGIRPGRKESEVESALLAHVRHAGARPSYPFVVGGGRNGAIPHYFSNDGAFAEGDLVVIDAGAAWRRYAADITRTFPVSGRFTAEQRRLYAAVLEAQRAAIARVRPGASFGEIHEAARAKLQEHGLARYFIHGTSHHVGLDVHDAGPTDALRPGMTLTIEPGIYLLEERVGIRIEDIVLVTENGCEVLTQGLPKEPDEVEAFLKRAAR